MAIIQKPDALSMSGNMKKFIVSSGSQIVFELKEGITTLLSATYEPGVDGRATIDVKDIIESRLSYTLSHTDFYEQTNIVKTFTANIDGSIVTFKVIRAGIANLVDTVTNWLRGNFLTWQPTNKQITYYSPEWITYYAQEACTVKLKATFPDAEQTLITLGSCVAGKAFTFNLQYAIVSGLLGQKYPTHYDVWVENLTGTRLTYIQRYLYTEQKSDLEQWFLFENSLGGLDTIRTSGDTDFTGEYDHKLSSTDNISKEYLVDTKRVYNQNTGYLDDYERRWLLDFFPAIQKYIYHVSAIRRIVVSDSDVKYSAAALPSSYNFSYHFTEENEAALLNLIRNQEAIPASITIPNLDSPDFHLPPRLSEYPRVPLHEGVILPAFDPNNEDPKVTTIGAILSAAVAEVFEIIDSGEHGELVDVLRSNSASEPSDFNVFSALRTMIEMSYLKDEIDEGKKYSEGINQKVDDVNERVKKIKAGTTNLLLNTGFLGDFKSLNIDALTAVLQETDINTNPLIHWVHNNVNVIDAPSRSGKGVSLINGSLQQTVVLKSDTEYVLSFWAKGTVLDVELVDSVSIEISEEYKRYSFDIRTAEAKGHTFGLLGTADIYEIMLSEGNTIVSYSYSEKDDLKAISQLQAINVITDAIKNYDTATLGGLILTSMIQLGKYKDGVMEKVNAGINGIYNNDNDPAFWAGGSFDNAIRTVQKFIDNPNYEPTASEWAEMANIVFTHGGDGFFRGYIYALGGFFRGKVAVGSSSKGEIILDPETSRLRFMRNGRLAGELFFTESGWVRMHFFDYWGNGNRQSIISLDTMNGLQMQKYDELGMLINDTVYRMDGQEFNGNLPDLTDAQADELLIPGQRYRTGRIIKVKI